MGGAIIGESAMVMDGLSDVGLGEGHGRSPVSFEEISFKSLFCQLISTLWCLDGTTFSTHRRVFTEYGSYNGFYCLRCRRPAVATFIVFFGKSVMSVNKVSDLPLFG